MIQAYESVRAAAEEFQTDLRTGAQIHAVRQIVQAERLRGGLSSLS